MIRFPESINAGAALLAEIEKRSGQRLSACYQCGRCTSTCVAAFAFDYPPHRLMRLLQVGMVREVLASRAAQLCLDCMTCSMRCPMKLDVAGVIETAKAVADEAGLKDSERDLRLFRRGFLNNVRRHGRLHEAGLFFWFNLRTNNLFNDAGLLPPMLRKKNFHFVPPRIRHRRQVRRLFQQINGRQG